MSTIKVEDVECWVFHKTIASDSVSRKKLTVRVANGEVPLYEIIQNGKVVKSTRNNIERAVEIYNKL